MNNDEAKKLAARYLGFKISTEKEVSSAKNPKGLRISAHTEVSEAYNFYHKQKGSACFKDGEWSSFEDLPFDTDWAWLMPLVLELIYDSRVDFCIQKTLVKTGSVGRFNISIGGKEYFSKSDTTKLVFEAVIDALTS